jgi:lysophospholipase L1-like esterase
VFYIDKNNSLKYADWQFWNKYEPEALIVGYYWGNNLFINGTHVVVEIDRNSNDKRYFVCIFGDSITAGDGSTQPYHYWDTRFGYHYNKNFGVGGSGYLTNATGSRYVGHGAIGRGTYEAAPTTNTILARIQEYASSIGANDAIVIAAGTNDFGAGRTLSEFRTAITTCYEYVLSHFANPLIVCTPIHRQTETNGSGLTLKQYVDIIKEVCESMQIPVIDFYNEVGLHPDRENWRTKYINDGLHPNLQGAQLMGKVFGWHMNKFIGDNTR